MRPPCAGSSRHDALDRHRAGLRRYLPHQTRGLRRAGPLAAKPAHAPCGGAITVALLSALTVMNTFAAGTALVIDARLAALGVAALALWLRLPFLLVVVLGAAAAGVVRWWGDRLLGCCRPGAASGS